MVSRRRDPCRRPSPSRGHQLWLIDLICLGWGWSSGSLRLERRRTLVRESGHGAGVADGVVGVWQVARSDRIYALVPLAGEERGDGRRTRVWVDGIAEPIIASRTEVTILRDMGQEAAVETPLLDDALDLASRLASAAEEGRVDLGDLGRRARRLLDATTGLREADRAHE